MTGDKLDTFVSDCKTVKGLYTVDHQTAYLGGVTNALWSAKNLAARLKNEKGL